MSDLTAYAADTIAAVATPVGMGGIAVVRVSGPNAQQVVAGVFRPARDIGATAHRRHTIAGGMRPTVECTTPVGSS